MRKTVYCLFGLIALGGLTTGCGTIINGSTQRVSITTVPSGASVRVGEQTVSSPGSVELKRKELHTLIVSKPGYKTKRINLTHEGSSVVWGDAALLIPGIVPGQVAFLVDTCTSSLWELTPAEGILTLEKKTASTEQNGSEIIERPDLALEDIFKPLANTQKTRICFISIHRLIFAKTRILDGDEAIAVVTPGKCITWERKPGNVTIDTYMVDAKLSKNIVAQGGKTYFLLHTAKNHMDIVDESQARQVIQKFAPAPKGDYIPFE